MESAKKENISLDSRHTSPDTRNTDQLAASCTQSATDPPPETFQLPTIKLVLLGVCVTLGNVALGYSANAVAVALDPLAEGLDIADKDLQWTINSYLIAYGCASLISGRAADLLGRRIVYLAGNAIYGAFTLIASFMPNQAGFFACRGVSGLGTAMVSASNVGLIVENSAPGRSRTLLVAACNAGLALGNAVGLGVAGPLVEATQWRAAFWFLAGLTTIPLLGTLILVKARPIALAQADKRIDWLGGSLFTAGFVLLFYSISQARSAKHGWATDYIIALFVLSLCCVGSALGWQRYLEVKTSFPPVLRTSILTRRRGRLALVCFVIFACMSSSAGFQFTTTIYYSRVVDLGPSQFALRFLPGPVVGVILNLIVGFFIGKIPSHWFLCSGSILTGLGNVMFAVRKGGSSYWTYEFFGMMLSYGMGLASCTGFIYITKVVKPTEVAVASSCLQFWTIFGGACGPALSTLVYTSVGKLDVSAHGDTTDMATKDSLLHGLRASHWFWAGLCFFGAVMAILLLRDTDAPDNQGQEIRNREGQEMNIEDNFAKRGDDSEMK